MNGLPVFEWSRWPRRRDSRHYSVERLRYFYLSLLQDVVPPDSGGGHSDLVKHSGNGDDRSVGEAVRWAGGTVAECKGRDLSRDGSKVNGRSVDGPDDGASSAYGFSLPFYQNVLSQTVVYIAEESDEEDLDSTRRHRAEEDAMRASEAAKNGKTAGGAAVAGRKSALATGDNNAAWRILSATPSPDKEGRDRGAVALRDDAAVSTLASARQTESRVVETIRCIGEIVARGGLRRGSGLATSRSTHSLPERPARLPPDKGAGDGYALFEYFCEKNMLALLAEIARSIPPPSPSSLPASESSKRQRRRRHKCRQPHLSGVTWTANVKSQVLQTVSILMSNVQDPTSLYYLLSNNHINNLLSAFLPLARWTPSALEEMIPVYSSFLKTLALLLSRSPHLVEFYVVDHNKLKDASDDEDNDEKTPSFKGTFPLVSAAVEVATSNYSKSDSFVALTALTVILNLCQVPHPDVRTVLMEDPSCCADQRRLLAYLCRGLCDRCRRIGRHVIGPPADPFRSESLFVELAELQDQLQFLNDLLWCGVRTLNVRLCEYIMRWILFRHLLPAVLLPTTSLDEDTEGLQPKNGVSRFTDGIPHSDAMSQASVFILAHFFMTLEYVPLQRMMAIALFHPLFPCKSYLERAMDTQNIHHGADYVITTSLNAVAQGRCRVEGTDTNGTTSSHEKADSGEEAVMVSENPYRAELMRLLSGTAGDWRFIPAAMVFECVLDSEAIGAEVFSSLRIVPVWSNPTATPETNCDDADDAAFENALGKFFNRKQLRSHSELSSTVALECGGGLALTFLSKCLERMNANGAQFARFGEKFMSSAIVEGIFDSKTFFAAEGERLRTKSNVADLYLDLMELEIQKRFNSPSTGSSAEEAGDNARMTMLLKKVNALTLKGDPEVLVLRAQEVKPTDVENAKFALSMTIYFKSLCEVLVEVMDTMRSVLGPQSLGSRWSMSFEMPTEVAADDDITTLGGLKCPSEIGTNLDVRGRTFFYFTPPLNFMDLRQSWAGISESEKERTLRFAEHVITRATPQMELVLVLDPSDLFVVKPNKRLGCSRGTIICSAPLRAVITAAVDGDWLHISIRKTQNVGGLIKNGKMALRFDSPATCLIVKQYLERCQTALNRRLMSRVERMLRKCCDNEVGDSFQEIWSRVESTSNDTVLLCSSNVVEDSYLYEEIVFDTVKPQTADEKTAEEPSTVSNERREEAKVVKV